MKRANNNVAEPTVTLPLVAAGAPAVDSAELMGRVDGDSELLAELYALFSADYPKQLAGLRDALSRQDARGVERSGHALKGALANLAAESARQLAAQIEGLGRAGDLSAVQQAIADLEQELHRVDAALAQLCQGVSLENSRR